MKKTLAGCAILKGNAILLLHRIKTNWYELPGGKIDEGETPQEAAKRELKEELLCDVEIIRQIGEKNFEENGYNMRYFWFLAKIKEGQEPAIGEPDTFNGFAYIPLEDMSKYELSPNMKNFSQALSEKSITIEG